jgi:hypothetical protein
VKKKGKNMRLKFVLTAVLFIISLAISGVNEARAGAKTASAKAAVCYVEEYTFQRILIEGIWWIFVFAPDGSFVDAYPDVDD